MTFWYNWIAKHKLPKEIYVVSRISQNAEIEQQLDGTISNLEQIPLKMISRKILSTDSLIIPKSTGRSLRHYCPKEGSTVCFADWPVMSVMRFLLLMTVCLIVLYLKRQKCLLKYLIIVPWSIKRDYVY